MYLMPVEAALDIQRGCAQNSGDSTMESHAQWALIRHLQQQMSELQSKVARLEAAATERQAA